MEAQVLGEETLREPVPAEAQFIHFIGANGVHVRERDQLHPGWRDRVEAWELAAGCGQGERERLCAVAEEIAAGQMLFWLKLWSILPITLLRLL